MSKFMCVCVCVCVGRGGGGGEGEEYSAYDQRHIMSTLEGYHKNIGGIMIHMEDMLQIGGAY